MTSNRTTVTSSIEIDTIPETIFVLASDPLRLPDWAPGFADRVEREDSGWQVTKGEKKFPVEVVVHESALTVDYLRLAPSGNKVGAFLRILPGPVAGSVIVMSLPVFPGATPEEVAALLEEELRALVRLVPPG